MLNGFKISLFLFSDAKNLELHILQEFLVHGEFYVFHDPYGENFPLVNGKLDEQFPLFLIDTVV